MSAVSKEDVLSLREKTGAGLIDCKRALVESNGDLDEAVSILRRKVLPLLPRKLVVTQEKELSHNALVRTEQKES